MAVENPTYDPIAKSLAEYQPERYWAVWQYPESRYAYMVGLRRDGWLIVMDSEESGQAALGDDARMNRRSPSLYRLDELSLLEAFEAARAQPVPFLTSYGTTVKAVKGVEVRSTGLLSFARARRIPL